MFKIQTYGKAETAVWLNTLETTLSTEDDGDILMQKGFLQEQATKVKLSTEGERLFLSDLTFNTDISINDELIAKGARVELFHADTIRIGDNQYEVFNPSIALQILNRKELKVPQWRLIGQSTWVNKKEFDVAHKTKLGHSKFCDISIAGAHLAEEHARFIIRGDELYVELIDREHSLSVNNQQLEKARLNHGDTLSFDTLSFQIFSIKQLNEQITASSDNVEVDAPKSNQNKEWVSKPTSVGNQVTESDLLLHKHRRNIRRTYIFFSLCIAAAIAAAIIWQRF